MVLAESIRPQIALLYLTEISPAPTKHIFGRLPASGSIRRLDSLSLRKVPRPPRVSSCCCLPVLPPSLCPVPLYLGYPHPPPPPPPPLPMSQMSTASSDNNAMSCSPPPHRTFEQEFLARAAVHRHHQQHHNQHQQRYHARGPQHRDVRPEDRVGGELPPASGKRGRSGSFDDADLGLER